MATKSPTGKDQKIKQEVMVTRHKSAQMKRQLRVKDRSMKHLTDLLKSPTKESQPAKTVPVKKKPSPKAKQSLLKSVEKIQNLPQKTFKLSKVLRKEILLVQDEEYYPNKRKRNIEVNKVVLKPKTTMKVVGEITGSVKRKYAVPLKVSDKSIPGLQPGLAPRTGSTKLSPASVKMSMVEAIQLMDEQLTDEDLMEILTCPSPVWWEDPPDEHYIEDALFTRSPEIEKKVTSPIPMKDSKAEINNDKIDPIPNLSAKSDKFLKKRSKLEDLLGNIKCNKHKNSNKDTSKDDKDTGKDNKDTRTDNKDTSKDNKDTSKDNKDTSTNNKDTSKDNDQNSEQKCTKVNSEDAMLICVNDRADTDKLESAINVPNTNEIIEKMDTNDFAVTTDTNEIKEDKNSDEFETKLAESDDEIIIHNSINEDELLMDLENMDIPIANDVIVIDDDDDFDKPNSEEIASKNYNESVNVDTNNLKLGVQKNLSAMEMSCDRILSPKSSDSLSSQSSVMLCKDVDTISDTNVRFLLEDDEDKRTAKEPNKFNNKSETDKATDNVTVYKIIEEIDHSDVTNESNEKSDKTDHIHNIVDAKLNDYFKKCKKIYQKRLKNDKTDINKNDMTDATDYKMLSCEKCKPTFKNVTENENVKYCLKCSAIFDSKDCTYCIKKTSRTCVICKIKFCCESYFQRHNLNSKHDNCELVKLDTKTRVSS